MKYLYDYIKIMFGYTDDDIECMSNAEIEIFAKDYLMYLDNCEGDVEWL